MPQRPLTLGLLWLAIAALLALLALLLNLRSGGADLIDAALALNLLLLPLPVLCVLVVRRRHRHAQAHIAAARAATEAKTRFLAQISHEIRTPMNAIMGMTQLALQTPLSAEQREMLLKADSASRTLLSLINDLLDVSKIEAGHMEIESQPLRLEDVVAQAVELVRPMHANPAVALVCRWADASLLGAHGQLRGDALRLQQVLVNLLSNALKFTPAGEVQLTLDVDLGAVGDRVPLVIRVQDSGIGMDAEQIAGLFREFRQGDASVHRRYGGTGLGLVITRRLVELMDGRLEVRSEPGRGSCFEIRLALPMDAGARPPTLLNPRPLLLADARAASRTSTEELLGHLGLGASVRTAATVEATLGALDERRRAGQPFAWLLVDWQLPGPGPTGAELLARLRRDHPGLRVAVMCTPTLDDGPAQARAFGARALCTKPLLAADLRRLLGDAQVERPLGADAESLAGLRVLLVEDHPVNQEIALRLLSGRGALVDVAGDGQEGLDKLQAAGAQAYDLVLMDLQMPVLDGLSATRRLRQLRGFEHLPVLAMTAHALAEERAQCLEAGMQGHIAKPLDVARLVRELQRYRPAPMPEPATPALDMTAGLRQFDGQVALYRRTLQGFAAQYAEGLGAWVAWVTDGEWAELRRAAHTLQGLAATLGAQDLHRLALALERSAAAADASGAMTLLGRAESALTALLAEVDEVLKTHGAAPAAVSRGRGDLAELRQLLSQSDSRALDWWQAHGSHCDLDDAATARLQQALAELDFDAALAALPAAEGAA
ncbi:response regulator [Roseateles cellulosilyticus]|uniref:histidine kinase n=1 Tax=Pelomonas cellulosilytica TaxID=2906762 RepID=A0ABS8XV66_9BURK|nr:response regulator [Pelomonas sp. P8]MCE4555108.1 response regulator [Pelomonas sp. P8]